MKDNKEAIGYLRKRKFDPYAQIYANPSLRAILSLTSTPVV